MIWPDAFIRSIQAQFPEEGDALVRSLSQPVQSSVLLNSSKPSTHLTGQPVPWNPSGLLLPERPAFTYDPLFHAGCYYPQESSSMFIGHVARQLGLPANARCLDLCGAPGGKSINLLESLGSAFLLVSNEIIRSRNAVLGENLIKWGSHNVVITQNDPRAYESLPGFFDLVLVDAPCSGEGLFRRDPSAADHWSEENVQHCAARQRRILPSAIETLAPGGYLIYSTCTFNSIENEEQVRWMQDEFGLEPMRIPTEDSWNLRGDEYGLKFLPHQVKGEGLFVALLRKPGEGPRATFRTPRKSDISRTKAPQELSALDLDSYQFRETTIAFPSLWKDELLICHDKLNITHFGTPLYQEARSGRIPDHAWAVSSVLEPSYPHFSLNREQALAYLARRDERLAMEVGWHLITCEGYSLGWAKGLGNRYNNYYPRNWRIRNLRT